MKKQLPNLPEQLSNKEFVTQLFQENWKQWFFDSRRWRLSLEEISRVDIEFLNFSPPQYDFLILATSRNGQALQFYEGILAKTELAQGEVALGNTRINNVSVHFVNGYTSTAYMKTRFTAWLQDMKLGKLRFIGKFPKVKGREAEIEIETLKALGKRGQEVTTNYLYRCKGWTGTPRQKTKFDMVIKRFLPRVPFERGNRELAMLKVLPKQIVPEVYGALTNNASKVNGENQVLVLFIEYVQGEEVGQTIWDLMKESAQKKDRRKQNERKLRLLAKKAVENVVFPFHHYAFKAWHSEGLKIQVEDTYYKWYFNELKQNLTTLADAGILKDEERSRLSEALKKAWTQILQDAKVTEIHGDLMWRQIMQTRQGRFVILDLDEHLKGHAAKDIAALCAANRFIAEDLPSQEKDYLRKLAEQLNAVILKTYKNNAAKIEAIWSENLETAVQIYLAYRHLHDAAYYAPAWRQATDPNLKRRYKRYVDFSMAWVRKSLSQLEKTLKKN